MKKELLKIIAIFLIVVGIVLWGLNYVFLKGVAPKSKAAGETMTMSFNPASISVAADQDFTVDVLINSSVATLLRGYGAKVNFDKSSLKFKSIVYKIGVVSPGLGDDTNASDTARINSSGVINIIGQVDAATGFSLTNSNVSLVTLTFTPLTAKSTSVTITNPAFYSIGTDGVLFNGWTVNKKNLSLLGGNVNLKMKLKFQGIIKLPSASQNSMIVKVKVDKEGAGVTTPVEGMGLFTSDDKEIWSGIVSVNLKPVTGNYTILVKGPQHIQKKICDSAPTETGQGLYRCSDGKITLVAGNNDLDFSKILLLSGDLDQNGVVDSADFALVRNNLGKTDAATLVKADLNRDGIVNTQDFSMILFALGIRTDEL